MNVIMIIYQESIFINPMFLLLCVLCEMVGVTHNYYYYSILKRHERDKLKTLLLSLNYTTTIHTLCIEHMYMKLRFQHPPTMKTCMCTRCAPVNPPLGGRIAPTRIVAMIMYTGVI
jgi:hypothetical protein